MVLESLGTLAIYCLFYPFLQQRTSDPHDAARLIHATKGKCEVDCEFRIGHCRLKVQTSDPKLAFECFGLSILRRECSIGNSGGCIIELAGNLGVLRKYPLTIISSSMYLVSAKCQRMLRRFTASSGLL